MKKFTRMEKKVLIICSLIVIVGGTYWAYPHLKYRYQKWQYDRTAIDLAAIPEPPTATPTPEPTPTLAPTATLVPTAKPTPTKIPTKTVTLNTGGLPPSLLIRGVPFVLQAPYGNFGGIHEDTCEESAILSVHKYLSGRKINTIPAAEAESDLQAMAAWENSHFGFYQSTNAAQTAEIARLYLGYSNTVVKYDISEVDIKSEIAAGNPVVVPAAGRLLGNPFFTQPGPYYHNLVITGYTTTDFITNDPGIGLGLNYHYKISVIMNAIHDWTGDDATIQQGRKAMIVLHK